MNLPQKIRSNLWVIIFFLLVTISFGRPFIENLTSLGRGDWDYFYFIHEVPQKTALVYGQFPLWNPYYCGGLSLIGNPQSRFLSPSFLLTSIFGVVPGLKIEILCHLFIGMVGMYWLLGYWTATPLVRIIPSIIFMFSGPLVFHLTEGDMVWLPAAYFPYAFLFFLKSLNNNKYVLATAALLALMLFEGATYVLNFFLLFLALFCVFQSLHFRNLKPLIQLLIVVALFILLAGPKLFPTFELVFQYPRKTPPGYPTPWNYLFDIFLDKNQSMYKLYEPEPNTGWWGFGAYIGTLPAILYLTSFRLLQRQWPLLLTSVILLLIGMGNFSKFSPWYLLHQLPLFSTMWVPSRVFIVFVFLLCILIGLNLEDLKKKMRLAPHFLLLLILGAVFCDLTTVNSSIFYQAFRPYKINTDHQVKWRHIPPKDKIGPFHQIEMSQQSQFHYGAWSAMYPMLLENIGVVNGYEPIPISRNAIPAGRADYQGEFYLLDNHGNATLTRWAPNSMNFKVSTPQNNVLVINQNFESNWKCNLPGRLRSHQGLLAVDVTPSDRRVALYYFPFSFLLGLIACVVGIGVSWWILKNDKKKVP